MRLFENYTKNGCQTSCMEILPQYGISPVCIRTILLLVICRTVLNRMSPVCIRTMVQFVPDMARYAFPLLLLHSLYGISMLPRFIMAGESKPMCRMIRNMKQTF